MRADGVVSPAGGSALPAVAETGADAGAVGRERLATIADGVAWAAFTAMLILAPFRAHAVMAERPVPPVYHAYTNLAVAWSELALLATLLAWVAALVLRPRPVDLGPPLVRWPWLAVLVLAWLTAPLSVDPMLAAWNALALTLVTWLAVYVLNAIGRLERLVPVVVVALALQAVVAVAQVATQASIGLGWLGEHAVTPATAGASVVAAADGTRFLRGYGLADHPNVLGGLVAAAALLVAFGARRIGVVVGAILVLSAVALLLTFSRGAWLAFLAGGLAGCLVLSLSADRARLRRLVLVGGTCAIVVAAAAFPLAPYLATRLDPGRPDVALEARSVDERGALAALAAGIIAEQPLGVGIGVLPIAMRTADPSLAFSYQPAHVAPLTVTAEIGLLGGAAYLAGLLAPWVLLVTRPVRGSAELAAATAALVALTVAGLFDYYTWTFPAGRIWWWLALGAWTLAWGSATRRAPGAEAIGR